MKPELKKEFLHSLFRLRGLLNAEFGKDVKGSGEGINIPEYILMKEISEHNSKITEISEYLAITKSAVSQILKTLEKRDYIVREIDADNRRSIIVSLTSAGQRALQEKDREFNVRFDNITGNMRDQDMEHMITLIYQLVDSIEQIKGEHKKGE